MILIADAAPLIFLSKINQLDLIPAILDVEIILPGIVKEEILGPQTPPDEERLLTAFLKGCRVVNIRKPKVFANALSFADNSVLTLAHRNHADIILSDDRLLRRVAVIEGFRVIGTIGILLHAKRGARLASKIAAGLLDELVEEHSFRISTRVYEAARKAIIQGS